MGTFYDEIPPFTRFWLLFTFFMSFLGYMDYIKIFGVILQYRRIVEEFEVWRLITSVFFYPISETTGVSFILTYYFLYAYSSRLESTVYRGKPADYAFLLLFCWLFCLLFGIIIDLRLIGEHMVLAVVYVWCKLNKGAKAPFIFGTRTRASYAPWILVALYLVTNIGLISLYSWLTLVSMNLYGYIANKPGYQGPHLFDYPSYYLYPLQEMVGIGVGHLYYFIMFKCPQYCGRPTALSAPAFLKVIFPETRLGGLFSYRKWGQGRTLADNSTNR